MSGNLPPRKGAYTKHITALHKDQYIRIQAKNAQELELMEDVHGYMKKRAVIEKTYADALLKLTSQYQSHKILPIPDISNQPKQGQEAQDASAGFGTVASEDKTKVIALLCRI